MHALYSHTLKLTVSANASARYQTEKSFNKGMTERRKRRFSDLSAISNINPHTTIRTTTLAKLASSSSLVATTSSLRGILHTQTAGDATDEVAAFFFSVVRQTTVEGKG